MTAPDMLGAALDYARRGWPVFPVHTPTASGGCSCRKVDCTTQGKHPRWNRDDLTDGLHSATTDTELIHRWWTRWPDANIGLRTGIAFDVLDLDDPDPDEAAATWPVIVDMPGGPVARTGKLGWHLFVLPTGLGNATKIAGSKADYRGDGGYVVAAPSLHVSGRRYAWSTCPDLELHPAAATLVKLMTEPRMPPRSDSPYVSPRRILARGTWSADPLVDKVAGASEGHRNGILNWAAVAVGFAVYNRRCTDRDATCAELRITEAARKAGLDEREIAATWRSGLEAGRAGRDPGTKKPKAEVAA